MFRIYCLCNIISYAYLPINTQIAELSHVIFGNFAFTPANVQISLKMSRTFLNLVLGELEFVSNLKISSLGFIQQGCASCNPR